MTIHFDLAIVCQQGANMETKFRGARHTFKVQRNAHDQKLKNCAVIRADLTLKAPLKRQVNSISARTTAVCILQNKI